MNDIKNKIINKLYVDKDIKIKEYDDMVDNVLNTNNYVELYYKLSNFYGNYYEQCLLQVDLLNYNLPTLFNNSSAKIGANYISYLIDDYYISFSTSLSKRIELQLNKDITNYNDIVIEPYKPTQLNNNIIDLYNATNNWLNHKSLHNLKVLADINGKHYKKNPIAKFFKYYNTIKKCNENLIEQIDKKQLKYNNDMKNYNEKIKLRKEYISKIKIDINNIIDSLYEWTEFGYKIIFDYPLSKILK